MNNDTPRTDAAVIAAPEYATPEYVNADFARELEREINDMQTRHAAVVLHTQSVVDENARLKIEQTYFDTLIMSVHYHCGGFIDVCPDDEFGNRMLEWLHDQRKRIMTASISDSA